MLHIKSNQTLLLGGPASLEWTEAVFMDKYSLSAPPLLLLTLSYTTPHAQHMSYTTKVLINLLACTYDKGPF